MIVDLHCHSTFSDGAHSPETLITMATKAGIDALALTDHDSLAGLNALHQAASDKPIRIINGIEFSTRWKKYELHIIGLNIPLDDSTFSAIVIKQRNSRQQRALEISRKLDAVGVENAYDKACQIAGHEHVARPHFAKVLLNEGRVKDLQSGFDRYLGRGKPAYVPTSWITVEEAVSAIVAAGGQAVIAHPLKYSLTRTKLRELINDFKGAGGIGIEVISGETMDSQIAELVKLCNRFELLASTGSDFHSEKTSQTKLGQQRPLPLNCKPIWTEWTF